MLLACMMVLVLTGCAGFGGSGQTRSTKQKNSSTPCAEEFFGVSISHSDMEEIEGSWFSGKGGMCINILMVHNLHMTGLELIETQLEHAQAHASRSSCMIFQLAQAQCMRVWSPHSHTPSSVTNNNKQQTTNNRQQTTAEAHDVRRDKTETDQSAGLSGTREVEHLRYRGSTPGVTAGKPQEHQTVQSAVPE